jgi:hypothetical protein
MFYLIVTEIRVSFYFFILKQCLKQKKAAVKLGPQEKEY